MSIDQLSEESQGYFSQILDVALPMMQEVLSKRREDLAPIAFVLPKNDEKIAPVGLMPEQEQANTDMESHLEAYRELLNKEYDKSAAHILFYDVRIKSEDKRFQSGIIGEARAKTGQRAKVLIPYARGRISPKVTFGDIERIG